MKKSLQLGALTAALLVALAGGLSRPAQANPSPCSTVSGHTCSPNGSATTCDEGGGEIVPCSCTGGHWRCKL